MKENVTQAKTDERMPVAPTQEEMNLAIAHFQSGAFDQAESFLIDLVHKYPDHPFAWKGVSVVLYQQGKIFEALNPMRELVRIAPEDAEAHSNLGSLLNEIGQKMEAEISLRRAVELLPEFAEGHFNLGNILKDLGRQHEAEQCYREALRLKPDLAEALCNLGLILKMRFQLQEAEAMLKKAVDISPGFAEAHFNMANVLHDQCRYSEAINGYEEAIRVRKGDYPEALSNLGVSFRAIGRYVMAEQKLNDALKLSPDCAETHNNLGVLLNELGRHNESEGCFREAIRLVPDMLAFRSNLLFLLSASSEDSRSKYLDEATQYGHLATALVKEKFTHAQTPDPFPNRIRVGFVSGDLRNHPVGFFVEGLARAIDTTKIEMLAFPTNLLLDDLSERISPLFSKWQPIYGLDDQVAAKMISGMVDILIDLSGHTEYNRLPVFAYKPAPVQVSWLGYWASTGMSEIDYLLGDPIVTPEGEESFYSETIWRFPETRFCYTPPNLDVPVRESPLLQKGHVTFGSFNKLNKLTDRVIAVWSEILLQLPHSRLFLKAKQLEDPEIRTLTESRFKSHGVFSHQLMFEGATSREDYLEAFSRVDIALDPFPFPGGATTGDALWMGVPVLTGKGRTLISRQGESMVSNVELEDWVAADDEDYVRKAIQFANDPEYLMALKDGLRDKVREAPLFNAERFARHFEDVIRSMWRDYCERSGVKVRATTGLDFSKWLNVDDGQT